MEYKTMPFGVHKGVLIEELPTAYKAYALVNFDLPDELVIHLFSSLLVDVANANPGLRGLIKKSIKPQQDEQL
jgi:uncharacterized protein (DUF3820 family)